ncbi:MAG: helix-turn-helix transcriptional regulator [Clostridiales bacterium]|nr:helix-turn-helix transcriptional regulator [Clostridiales bacterium]
MVSYKKLWHVLVDRNMNKRDLIRLSGISTASMAKLTKGENLQTDVLVKICRALEVNVSDIMDILPDESNNGGSAEKK